MPSINAVHSYLIKPITIPRYLRTVYCLCGAAPISLSIKMFIFASIPHTTETILVFCLHLTIKILINSLTPICLLAGTKNYPSGDFLRRNSTFFLVSATQPQPTNNTIMVSFRRLQWHEFYS